MKYKHLNTLRQFSHYLSFATSVLSRAPHHSDSLTDVFAKASSILSMTIDEFFNEDPNPHEILKEMGLSYTLNKAFVAMFFGTSIHNVFDIERQRVSEYNQIITARSKSTTLYFVSFDSGQTINAKFWHAKDVDFAGIVKHMWTIFNDRVHVELKKDNFEFSHVFESKDPTFGEQANKMFNEFQDQHKRYVCDGIPRTYLLCGKPGVGKTAFAERLSRINSRTMRLAAASMTLLDFKSISFLVDIMKPSFLIIDDIDRNLDNDRALSSLFVIFEAFKRKHPDVTIVMTVNDIKKLDAALLRPGRIDEIIDFEVPNNDERRIIIIGYMNTFGIKQEDIDITDLVKASEGLTPAYLREIALQLRYKPVPKIVKIVKRMLELSSDGDVEDDDDVDDDGCDYEDDYTAGYTKDEE